MKQFLYLDSDIVNSIIAQEEQGITSEISKENEEGTEESSENNKTASVSGDVNGGFWKVFNAEADIGGQFNHSDEDTSHATSREIITKTLHDAAYDMAYHYIAPVNINMEDKVQHDYGEYVELNTFFDIWDFDYLEKLVKDDQLIEMAKQQDKEKLKVSFKKEAENSFNREQRRSSEKELKQRFNELIEQNNEQYDNLKDELGILKLLFPYRRLLVSQNNGYIISLEDKYFRIDPKNLGFKYGGPMTCVGMITNIITKEFNSNEMPKGLAIQNSINSTLFNFFKTNKLKLYVLHPIAVYYQNKL